MEILQNVIGTLNKEEIRHFKLFANRSHGGEERKDVLLFDMIRSSFPEYDEEKMNKALYGTEEKNALYRLKNRLLESIGKSIALQYFDQHEANVVMNLIVLARLFQNKAQAKTAFYYLGKAEKKANEIESPELLELIYTDLIKLSYETLEINPGEYISKRKENRKKLSKLQEIDDILAGIIYSVKTLQSFSKSNLRAVESLQEKVNEIAGTKEFRNDNQLRFKIYHSISRILLQKEDYPSLEKYLVSTYTEYRRQGLFNKNNHETKLQMLTYLINALFKNDHYNESLNYGDELKKAMEEFGGMLKGKYLFYYYNSQVNNYSKIDVNKAIEILNEARENPIIRKHPYHIVFVYLNLSVSSFDKGNFKEALRWLIKPSLHDTYRMLDEGFRYRIAVVELIIRYELEDFDYIEHRIKQIKSGFRSFFRDPAYLRMRELMGILLAMIGPGGLKSRKLAEKVARLTGGGTDHDIINYSEWLQAKMRG